MVNIPSLRQRIRRNDSGVIDEKEGTCNNESEVQTNKVDELRMLESGFVSTLFLTFQEALASYRCLL